MSGVLLQRTEKQEDRHLYERFVSICPPVWVYRDLLLPGESKNHSTASCHNTDDGEDQADQRQPRVGLELEYENERFPHSHQKTDSSRVAFASVDEDLQQRTGCGCCDLFHVACDK